MNNQSPEMPFWDHLEELRWRLIKSIIAILIGAGFSYAYSDIIMYWLINPTESLSIDLNLQVLNCHLYTSPSPRDRTRSRMPSSA